MNMGYETRYKDCDPLKTIERIRTILTGLGILTREQWIDNIDGYYSIFMKAEDMGLFSNGKGTTQAYALASAYAEFIERLQNLVFVTFNKGMREEAIRYKGFSLAPDEKMISIDEILNSDEDWISAFTGEASTREERRNILEKWHSVGYYMDTDNFIALPYMNITEKSLCYIPVVMLTSAYGTNGMCAGNTASEAIVQGISEVIERYVMKRILYDRTTPPAIPKPYIEANYPFLYNMIKRLESKGDFKVIIKDCSLGKGFPVVAVIMTDMRRHSYFVRFGSHPAFEIALERCLTELLQGKKFDKPDWMTSFSFPDDNIYTNKNLTYLFTNGVGNYPVELFCGKDSYKFTGIEDMRDCNNEEMLSYLTGLLHAEGCSIMIRDVSFLGFPCYHIVVPFFSEIVDSKFCNIDEYLQLRSQANKKIPPILKRLGNTSDNELKEVNEFLIKSECAPDYSIAKLLNTWLGTDFPWNHIKRDLFLSSAYYRLGDYKKASEKMGQYIKETRSSYNDITLIYNNCVKDYYGSLAYGLKSEAAISDMLVKLYPEKVVKRVISNMRNPAEVFRNCLSLDCFNCSTCPYNNQCKYTRNEELFKKIKEIYAQNSIDQQRVNSYF